MIKGFNDCCDDAQTKITGGQSIMNPWPTIGGVANVVCKEGEYSSPNYGVVGDKIILTKPLGTQVAVNLREWRHDSKDLWKKSGITDEQEDHIFELAVSSMATLNRNAAHLMHKYESHGATDITGFGLLGHARNLAAAQKGDVDFVIHSIPVID